MTTPPATPAPDSPTDALATWTSRDSYSFDLNHPASLDAAAGHLIAQLPPATDILALGEALHGGEEILLLRNHLFQRLVQSHGYTAIAVESSYPRAKLVDLYIGIACNEENPSLDTVHDLGFSHGFGDLEANRELIEWMRAYNRDYYASLSPAPSSASPPAAPHPLRFYGFDGPMEMMHTNSPRQLLDHALEFLHPIDGDENDERRAHLRDLIGDDAAWETPEAAMNPAKSIGNSPNAQALRLEVDNLIAELEFRRPGLIAHRGADRFHQALHDLRSTRSLLNYHAAVATDSPNRLATLLGIRDSMMADNLAYFADRERARGGKLLAFAHNSHLKLGQAHWQLGPHALAWWPAGAQLRAMLGTRYIAIGTALVASPENGILPPGPNTIESHLASAPGPQRLIPTARARSISQAGLATLPTRAPSPKNSTYFPLTPTFPTDYDYLITLDTTTYSRGGRPLP